MQRKTIAISLLGTVLDFAGKRWDRWHKWRPNIGLCSQEDLPIHQLYLLHDNHSARLAETVKADISEVSEDTEVNLQTMHFDDPWDFEEVYAKLYDWCKAFSFETDTYDYLFHITTGSHVVQVCGFMLTESNYFPGRVIQTSPDKNKDKEYIGRAHIIDTDLSKYEKLASRFEQEKLQSTDILKTGILTQNDNLNNLIQEIEKVASRSNAPLLISGDLGTGKRNLASNIHALKTSKSMLKGPFVVLNCASLDKQNARAQLCGHLHKSEAHGDAHTLAYLADAEGGTLFLDEISNLSLEAQDIILQVIKEGEFLASGSETPTKCNIQLIAATSKDLKLETQQGRFSESLFAQLSLWQYPLPSLGQRIVDIPENIEYELTRYAQEQNKQVRFSEDAKDLFIELASADNASWRGNFIDFKAALLRLCTLSDGVISAELVLQEFEKLHRQWADKNEFNPASSEQGNSLESDNQFENNESKITNTDDLISSLKEVSIKAEKLDTFDRNQLGFVVNVCRTKPSMAAAGRALFDVSRQTKTSSNDSSRLQKYLAKFGLRWADLAKLK
jgi:transcriptional regulatory protein RtcR